MFYKKGNLLSNSFIANFLEVYRKAMLLKTFRHTKLKREFTLTFYKDFNSLFIGLQDLTNQLIFEQILQLWLIDEQSRKNMDEYIHQKKELYPELLNINYLELVTDDFENESYLGLYNYLVKSYVISIPDFKLADTDDYLLFLIETYLSISIDLKSFDAIKNVESYLFENGKPIDNLIKKNNRIYFNIVEMYSMLDEVEKAKNLSIDIFSQMDLEYISDLTYDKFAIKFYSTNTDSKDEELKSLLFRTNHTYYFKDQRTEFIDNLTKPKPKWTFSNLEQASNAFRLGLISEERFKTSKARFIKEQNSILLLSKELPCAFTFLDIDDKFNDLTGIELQSPQPSNSNQLDSVEQKIEYLNIFYKTPNLFGIRKFMQLRIERFYSYIIQFGRNDLIDTAIAEEALFNKIDKAVAPLGRFDNLKKMGQAAFDYSFMQTTVFEIVIKENNIDCIFNITLIKNHSFPKMYRINVDSSYTELFDLVSTVPEFVIDIIMRNNTSNSEIDENHKIFLSLKGIAIDYTENKKRLEIFYNPESGKEYRTTITEATIMSNSIDWVAILKRFEIKL